MSNNQLSFKGTVKEIGNVQEFKNNFTKRDLIVTMPDGQYPQDIKVEFIKDKTSLLNSLSIGQEVEVFFNLRGREYEGNYYTSVQGWKINSSESGGVKPNNDFATTGKLKDIDTSDFGANQEEDDSLPF